MRRKWLIGLGRKARRTGGFTLLELLVVLAILGLIAAFIGPEVLNLLSGAKADSAKIQMKNIEASLDLYRLDVGKYPNQDEGLDALVRAPGQAERWRGPYLRSAEGLKDPWGKPYNYRRPGRENEYDIFSFGADQAEGGDGEDADIYN